MYTIAAIVVAAAIAAVIGAFYKMHRELRTLQYQLSSVRDPVPGGARLGRPEVDARNVAPRTPSQPPPAELKPPYEAEVTDTQDLAFDSGELFDGTEFAPPRMKREPGRTTMETAAIHRPGRPRIETPVGSPRDALVPRAAHEEQLIDVGSISIRSERLAG